MDADDPIPPAVPHTDGTTAPLCGDRHEEVPSLACTLGRGHHGRHEAYGKHGLLAWWAPDPAEVDKLRTALTAERAAREQAEALLRRVVAWDEGRDSDPEWWHGLIDDIRATLEVP